MRIRGRDFSKWWLLLAIPLLVVASPLLLMGLFLGNDLAGAIFGPPAIWDRPWHTPLHADLAGRYLGPVNTIGAAAILTLNPDGSMIVRDLPDEFGESSCFLSGKGTWSGPDEDQKVDLDLTSEGSPGSCRSGSYSLLELAGHFKPYRLYRVLGDPDSGTGIWLTKDQ